SAGRQRTGGVPRRHRPIRRADAARSPGPPSNEGAPKGWAVWRNRRGWILGPAASGKLVGLLCPEYAEEAGDRVEELIDDAFLQRDDRIIGDRDVLGADLGAAFGDVAEADAVFVADFGDAVFGVERVHLEGGEVDEVAGSGELRVLAVLAQHMADVLAQEALDALAELLHAVDVGLMHGPASVGVVGLARLEGLDALLDAVVP